MASALYELQWLAQSLRESLGLNYHLKQLLRSTPKYLKLRTIPNFHPFTLISLWMPFALFVISLIFSAMISIVNLVQIWSRLSTMASSSCSFSARASLPSANHRFVIFLPPLCYFSYLPSCSSRASDIIRSRYTRKHFRSP